MNRFGLGLGLALGLAPTVLAACRGGVSGEGRRDGGDSGDGLAATSASPSAQPSARARVAAEPVSIDVASNASAAWEAGAPATVAANGEVDGAALRSRHRARLAADRAPVAVLRGGTPLELGARICEAKLPKRSRPEDVPVLVKPNLGGFEWFKDPAKSGGDDGLVGRITDPEFVRGIVRCLKARGHTRITIAEGWGATHADWKRLVKLSGYEAMTREEGVPLVAMDDDGVFDVEGATPGKPLRVRGMEGTASPTLLVPKILAEHLEHGLFVSAPKIKAHRFGVVSVGIKGGQGTVMLSDAAPAFRQKWRMHKELGDALTLLPKNREKGQAAYLAALDVFAERMADVLEINAPDVVLADGAPMVGGDGFGKRWPSDERVAVGGTNAILVDRVAADLLGLWDNDDLARELGGHRTSPLITTAAKRVGLPADVLASPSVEGDGAALLAAPRPVHFVSMSGFSIHGTAGPRASEPGDAGASDAGAAASTPSERPIARATKVAPDAFVIDGKRDAAWSAIPAVVFDTDWSGAPSGTRTSVRLAWSPGALFALWELEGAGIHVDASRPVDVEREKLYEEDCVELFLSPDPAEPNRYVEVEVGPLGHVLDLTVDRRSRPVRSDVSWSSKPTVKTTVDRGARKATIEVVLRAPEITRALRAGASLPLALYRMEGRPDGAGAAAKRQYLAWSPTRTKRPDFHVPGAFGTLLLGE